MFSFNQSENVNQLHAHNIRITELNPTLSRMSQSQPHVVHLPKVRMLSRGSRSGPGVRINNVKTIKPPDPEVVKKLEEEKLRAQNSKPAVIISIQRQVQAIQHYRLLDGAALERLHCEILGSLSIPSSAQIVALEPIQPHLISAEGEESKDTHVEEEIVNRSQNCAHTSYDCSLPVLSGYQYCHRHILDDPAAPFRQCAHLYSNGERCPIPTPSEPRDLRDPGLCFEHARAVLCMRQRSAAPPPPVASTETLLNQLQHYVKPERPRTTSCASTVSVVSDPAEQEQLPPQAVDPFKQINATAVNAAYSASIMEYASCSDSDGDSVTLGPGGDCRAGGHEDLSDAEDAPCEELPLWRAGVYTVEEAVSEANNMLHLLQSAYLRQMDRMRVLLRTSRLQYLRKLKAEKEQYCSINSQARSGPLTARERRQLRKLKAFASYHRRHGVDAVLARKLHHKRAKMYDPCPNRPIPSQGRCTFTEGGVRCPQHVLPASKLCLKHILHDRHQVLFAPCGDMRGVTSCREPIPKLPLPSSACRYHTDPPVYTVFTLKKDESDSDSDSHSTSDPESPHTEVTEDVALNTDNSADDRQDIGEVMLPPDNAFE